MAWMIDEIEREQDGLALIRLTHETQGKAWHVVLLDRDQGQVRSEGPDCPRAGGQYFAGITGEGVRYVSSPRSREAAQRRFRRARTEARANPY